MSLTLDASYVGAVAGEVGSSVAVNADGTVFAFGNVQFDGPGESNNGNVVVGSVSGGEFVFDASYVGAPSSRVGSDIAINGVGEKVIFGQSLFSNKVYAGTVSGNEIIIDASFEEETLGGETLGGTVDINYSGDVFCFSDRLYDANKGKIYIASVSGGEFVIDASYVGGTDDRIGSVVSINNEGDTVAFTSGQINAVYLASVSGGTLIVDSSMSTGISTQGAVAINGAGDIVAFTAGSSVFVTSASGNQLVVDASLNIGFSSNPSVDINGVGSKLIVSNPNFDAPDRTNAGKVFFLSVSGNELIIDASFVGEYNDQIGNGQKTVAIDSIGRTYIFSEPNYDGSGGTGTDVGKVYIASFPDTDGDGVIDLNDIFANQQLNVVPTAIPGLTNVFAIAPGKHHTLVITRDGRVLSFGRNQSGQLGRLTTDVSGHVPADVSGASNGYAAIEAAARLPAGDAYVREDVYGSTAQKRAVKIMLGALVSQLDGTEGFNTELARHYLANL